MSEAIREKTDRETALLAEGEAALWLSESLILALLEAKVLDTEAMLEEIEIVIAAKRAGRTEAGGSRDPDISRAAAAQVASISSSIAAARAVAAPDRMPRKRRGGTKRSG